VDVETKERKKKKKKKNWMEGIRKAMNKRNLNEGQWEDRKQCSLGVGQRRKTFLNRHIYIYIYIHIYVFPPVNLYPTNVENWASS
jgi:hypothetical protein